MGVDKALLVPGDGGPPLARRAAQALAGAGADPVVAVGGDAGALADLGFTVLADREPDQGPLVGLATGLRAATTTVAVVLTCDMPAIDAPTVERLVDALAAHPGADGAMPVSEGRRQVLTAAYRTDVADHLDAVLATGERSVRRALDGLRIVELDGLDPRRLVDLDRPEDLDHYARTAGPRRADDPDPRASYRVDIPQIDVATLAQAHAAGATVLDVRNPDEYVAGHVPGAILIPLPELAARVDEVPAGDPLYVICAMGGRSQKACEHLATTGRSVANVAGGTTAWIEAGNDVTAGDQP